MNLPPLSQKPTVTGPVDSNIFAVLGAATRTLKRAKLPDYAKELSGRVMGGEAHSYYEALAIIQEYVEFDL